MNLVELLGNIIITSYIIMCPLIVKRICDEKVAKAKEMLKMMGMSDWVFWGSHFINYFTIMFIQSIFTMLLYCYGFGRIPYVMYSNAFIFFISLVLFNVSTILSSMLLTTVFNRPVIAVVVSVILFEVSHSVPMCIFSPTFNPNINVPGITGWRLLTCLLPNSGMQWVLTAIGKVEIYNRGVTWSNLWQDVPKLGHFSVGAVMLMQFTSILFYGMS